eukprot:TRINITY_DN1615_c0_g1_i1.p1 TRINITY_DN1615_c0_g1~~TRINITY_DN1615_c0_g1_i1.p1  ORF type:complete len:148 (-),score=51.23 TRINITY_DN1615_c0_g1_i1:20-463(-)
MMEEKNRTRERILIESDASHDKQSGQETFSNLVSGKLLSRRVDQETYERVCRMSARLFAGIRFFFSKFARNKLNAFYLDPIFQKLGIELTEHFCWLSNDEYEEMFETGLENLQQRQQKLELQLKKCLENRNNFRELFKKMKQTQGFQ